MLLSNVIYPQKEKPSLHLYLTEYFYSPSLSINGSSPCSQISYIKIPTPKRQSFQKTEWLQASSRLIVNLSNMKGTTVHWAVALAWHSKIIPRPSSYDSISCAAPCERVQGGAGSQPSAQLSPPALSPPGTRAMSSIRVAPAHKLLFQGQ